MKIQMLRDVMVQVYDDRLDEVYDKQLRKWDVIIVDTINDHQGKTADVYGDLVEYWDVPVDSFKIL